ncbi:MAG TPA: twin-arginine translocase TatA/TatE family subunit [Microbacterium sp.]|mgnify:CR=1 FL=1|nr:twin-arginine translocase TatA/TatE family subunit [Microbacterium sp.]
MGNLTGWHALILLAVILLLFGAAKLPALAKSVGQSARIFKSEIKPANRAGAGDASKNAAEEPTAVTASEGVTADATAIGAPRPNES